MKYLWGLFVWGGIGLCQAQPHNGELYRRLLEPYFATHSPLRALSGDTLAGWMPPFRIDSTSKLSVELGIPALSYRRLSKDQFLREIHLYITEQDTLLRPVELLHTDTLSRQGLKQVRKQSPSLFRGENPLSGPTFLRPALTIVLSMSAVLSLYYIRSARK
ncbi:MAG: hypothetical protein EAZ89_14180 [Bacteroidetes bacterium]|nr:MAG: hypothetical protein EAZ89_14180 [Bacteroidota bacterium]